VGCLVSSLRLIVWGGFLRGFAIGYWLLAIGYWLLAIGYWLLAIREALPEAGVLQGFHYFASEEHEQDSDRNDTENGAGH
jgi:hypothetical protein